MMGQMLNFVGTQTASFVFFFFCRRYDITDITLQSQGYISNVDAHTRVLAADTVCRAPDNAILCR